MVKQQNIKPAFERIEFAKVWHDSRIAPREAGEPMFPYPPRDLGEWQPREVKVAVANICRALSRRGPHGVHVDVIGGPDLLAELDLYGIPYKVTDNSKRGKWGQPVWVVPEVIFRFAEDREAAAA